MLVFARHPEQMPLVIQISFTFGRDEKSTVEIFPAFFCNETTCHSKLIFLRPPLYSRNSRPIHRVGQLFHIHRKTRCKRFRQNGYVRLTADPPEQFSIITQIFISVLPNNMRLDHTDTQIVCHDIKFEQSFPGDKLSLLCNAHGYHGYLYPHHP